MQSQNVLPKHFELNRLINEIPGNVSVYGTSEVIPTAIRQHRIANEELKAEAATALIELTEMEMLPSDDITDWPQFILLRDGLADTIVTYDGLAILLGLDVSRCYDRTSHEDEFSTLPWSERVQAAMALWAHVVIPTHDMLGSMFRAAKLTPHVYNHRVVSDLVALVISYAEQASRIMGIDVDADQETVYQSNISKFDTDLSIANLGLRRYLDKGIPAAIFPNEVNGTTYYVIKVTQDHTDENGKDYTRGKFLKGINFKEPQFDAIEEKTPEAV